MRGPSTTVVHADREHHHEAGIAPAIHQTVAFASESDAEFSAAATELRGERFYTRYGNPNHAQVAEVVAGLEGAEAGLVMASGMAALATCVLALVEAGDHVVGQLATYGGTAALMQQLLPRLGITYTQVDQTDVAAFEAAMTARTKLVLLESPSNPLLKVTDLEAVAALAGARGALTLADNTFASPINQQPLGLGVDIVWHSATKYLNGHGDVSAGVIAGRSDHLDRIAKVGILTGATLGPVDSWLLLRGLRTLPLRMQRHNANGLALARVLYGHPAVSAVHYPGLESSPQHALASRQMTGFGGVLAFELEGGQEAAIKLLERLELARRSASLGSPGTLAIRPAAMWAGTVEEDLLTAAGVSQGLIRVAAGLEDTDDLVADLLNALDRPSPWSQTARAPRSGERAGSLRSEQSPSSITSRPPSPAADAPSPPPFSTPARNLQLFVRRQEEVSSIYRNVLVERWSAELTTKWIKRGSHCSVRDLVPSIRTWITNWNDNPKPFVWDNTADEVLDSLNQ